MIGVQVFTLTSSAQMPRYAHDGDSGCDLAADEEITIPPGQRGIVHTGISLSMSPGVEAQIRSRSGLAAKQGIFVLNSPGTIDSNYRGEICVCLLNTSDEFFKVKVGDRIAQIVFAPVYRALFERVTVLNDTERGSGGFGSTGVN